MLRCDLGACSCKCQGFGGGPERKHTAERSSASPWLKTGSSKTRGVLWTKIVECHCSIGTNATCRCRILDGMQDISRRCSAQCSHRLCSFHTACLLCSSKSALKHMRSSSLHLPYKGHAIMMSSQSTRADRLNAVLLAKCCNCWMSVTLLC